MKPKQIARLIVTLIVAAFSAWQYFGPEERAKNPGSQTQHQRASGHEGKRVQSNQQVGDFDYYLISLSWSPAYCSTHPQDKTQCGGRGFGFILHGLWPQKSTGGWPENCPATSQPSRSMIEKTLAFMPSEKLITHEWSKHGTCTGLTADQYLALADQAYSAIKIPARFQTPEQSVQLSADQISAAFVQANVGLPQDSVRVKCSKGELEEVRVCVDTKLQPTSCGKGVRSQCGKEPVEIRAMR